MLGGTLVGFPVGLVARENQARFLLLRAREDLLAHGVGNVPRERNSWSCSLHPRVTFGGNGSSPPRRAAGFRFVFGDSGARGDF